MRQISLKKAIETEARAKDKVEEERRAGREIQKGEIWMDISMEIERD